MSVCLFLLIQEGVKKCKFSWKLIGIGAFLVPRGEVKISLTDLGQKDPLVP